MAVLAVIGKILLGILWVILGLLVLIVLLLQVHAGVRFSYDQGDLALWVKYGPVRLQLFPKKEKPEKEKRPKKKKEKPEKKEPEKKKKPKKPRAKINREQILYALEKLPPILGRALKRTGKSIRVRPLKLWVLVAGSDPADTAELYGRLEAAVGAGLPMLEKALHIRDEDVRLYPDFTQDRMDFIADVGVELRPWRLVTMGVRALGSLVKVYFGFRKLASPPPPAEEEKQEAPREDKEDAAA